MDPLPHLTAWYARLTPEHAEDFQERAGLYEHATEPPIPREEAETMAAWDLHRDGAPIPSVKDIERHWCAKGTE